MMARRLALDDRLLAVVCASHDGRPEHIAAVRAILAGAGLDEADLENTPTLPLDADAMHEARAERRGPGADPAELQRQACGDAGDGGRQRLADRRLHGRRPPAAAADPRRPRPRRRRRRSTSASTAAAPRRRS